MTGGLHRQLRLSDSGVRRWSSASMASKISATPPRQSVDRLFHVAHAEERAALGALDHPVGKGTQHAPLKRGRVLEFVQQQVRDMAVEPVDDVVQSPRLRGRRTVFA